jgi:hypothetical protein
MQSTPAKSLASGHTWGALIVCGLALAAVSFKHRTMLANHHPPSHSLHPPLRQPVPQCNGCNFVCIMTRRYLSSARSRDPHCLQQDRKHHHLVMAADRQAIRTLNVIKHLSSHTPPTFRKPNSTSDTSAEATHIPEPLRHWGDDDVVLAEMDVVSRLRVSLPRLAKPSQYLNE